MLLAELLCKLCRRVSFIDDDSLLLIRSKVYVDEQEGRVRVLLVIFVIFFALSAVGRLLATFLCFSLLDLVLICVVDILELR